MNASLVSMQEWVNWVTSVRNAHKWHPPPVDQSVVVHPRPHLPSCACWCRHPHHTLVHLQDPPTGIHPSIIHTGRAPIMIHSTLRNKASLLFFFFHIWINIRLKLLEGFVLHTLYSVLWMVLVITVFVHMFEHMIGYLSWPGTVTIAASYGKPAPTCERILAIGATSFISIFITS
jgi:hypothetical protein